ncbi:hypothetical protein ACFFLM_06065 [Deinococcus oregonensis]|uniref:Type II toxin-antitoxin system HicA family toxin n=1 Tax=Deinococcus oregonensis TaxID=1805970 RepID=A0ABV6AVK2_9DEIO
MKVRQLEALLAQHGWLYRPRMGTEHRHWHHPVEGAITFSGNMADDCDPAQEDAVLNWLGLSHLDLRPDLCKPTSK